MLLYPIWKWWNDYEQLFLATYKSLDAVKLPKYETSGSSLQLIADMWCFLVDCFFSCRHTLAEWLIIWQLLHVFPHAGQFLEAWCNPHLEHGRLLRWEVEILLFWCLTELLAGWFWDFLKFWRLIASTCEDDEDWDIERECTFEISADLHSFKAFFKVSSDSLKSRSRKISSLALE